jgi:DNA-binding XRE family transcriptional regulator
VHNGDMRGKQYPAHRDWQAADLVRQLREDHGLSPEQLAEKIALLAGKGDTLYPISSRTIYRIENNGQEPTVRVKFALATVFDRLPSDIWNQRKGCRA